MAALTNFAIPKTLDAILRSAFGAIPSIWYYALYTTIQDAAQSATECTDASYARQIVGFNAASAGESVNSAAVTFPAFAGSQTIKAVGICDSLVGGNAWLFQNLQVSGTNLTVDGASNVTVTPDGYTPVVGDVGSLVTVSGGPHWTVGVYSVSSISGGAWVLNTSPAVVSSTGGIWTFNKGVVVGAGSSARVASGGQAVSAV